MTKIVIDNKKYVILPENQFLELQQKASIRARPEKLLSIDEARAHSKALIRKWAGAK